MKEIDKVFRPSSSLLYSFTNILVLTILFSLLTTILASLSVMLQQAMAQSIITAKSEKMFDANLLVQNSDAKTMFLYSKLSYLQSASGSQTIANTTKYKVNTTPGFLTYENPSLGITMKYPSDWLKREYPFNPATNNNTLITFFSPSPSASALGNVSGVSGTFVPYVDIFVFSSKNMSIDEIVNGAINGFANSNLNESKSIVLKDNNPAHVLVYTVRIAGDELFKRMQVWTIRDYKVYVITFTAEEALYSEYLPKVQRMINSLEIRSPAVTS
jgi:hypothetical protein